MDVDKVTCRSKESISDAITESFIENSMVGASSMGDWSPAPTELDSPSDSDAVAKSLCVHDSDSDVGDSKKPSTHPEVDSCSQRGYDTSNDSKSDSCHTNPDSCQGERSIFAKSCCKDLILKDSTNLNDSQAGSESYRRRLPTSQSAHSLKAVFGVANALSQKAMSSSKLANSAPLKRRHTRRQESASTQASAIQYESASVEPPRQLSRPKGGLIELRQERRQREAEFRLGLLEAKPPVIHFDPSRRDWFDLELPRTTVANEKTASLKVLLPLVATNSQKVMAQCAVDALDQSGCALLEAPTGTGKTLAMLGTSLAWQFAEVNRISKENGNSRMLRKTVDDKSCVNPSPTEPPRVIWVARTHEQLLHAVNEFRRLPYRPVMSLRLSRERFCMLPIVRASRNKAEACELATTIAPMKARQGAKQGNRPPQPAGCSYLEHAEAMHYPQAARHLRRYELGGPLAVYDIEDLVKEAHAMHICPFHAVGDVAMEGAGLIFMTYNQMLDPLVRFAGGYGATLQRCHRDC